MTSTVAVATVTRSDEETASGFTYKEGTLVTWGRVRPVGYAVEKNGARVVVNERVYEMRLSASISGLTQAQAYWLSSGWRVAAESRRRLGG